MPSISIKVISNNTTIDLSSFFDSNNILINWGDNISTDNTLTHTYINSGVYIINSNEFNNINNIKNNVVFYNIKNIKFNNFKQNIIIGDNFLNNSSQLEYVDMSEMNVESIGSNFLNGCQLKCLKVPYKNNITLSSWGNNIIKTDGKIFCGIYKQYYQSASVWSTYSSKMFDTEYEYSLINKNIVNNKTIGTFPIFNNNYFDLTLLPNLRTAVNNESIKTETTITEYIDSNTRQVYYKNIDLKKQYFIYSFKYRFSFDKGTTFNNIYIYNRYFKALRVENNKLYVKSFIPETYFYLKDEEKDIDFSIINEKYRARDILEDHNDSNYIESIRYKLSEWVDKKDPNYAMGKIIFGKIDDSVVKTLNYDGDVETGFTIKIIARGACKNLKIFALETDPKTEKRPYLWIKTDQMPSNSIINGDIITINTRTGHKSAKLIRNGQEINIMKYIDTNSTWLRIKHGPNSFFCEAEKNGGSILNLNINLIYDDLYEGI